MYMKQFGIGNYDQPHSIIITQHILKTKYKPAEIATFAVVE